MRRGAGGGGAAFPDGGSFLRGLSRAGGEPHLAREWWDGDSLVDATALHTAAAPTAGAVREGGEELSKGEAFTTRGDEGDWRPNAGADVWKG